MEYTSKAQACRKAESLLIEGGATEPEVAKVMAALAQPAVRLGDFVALLDGPYAVAKLKSFAGE